MSTELPEPRPPDGLRLPDALASSATPDVRPFNAAYSAGLLELQQGNYAEGVKLMTAALQINPNSAEAWANLGLGLGMLHRHDEAVASFDQALAIEPDHVDLLASRGAAFGNLGRHQEAIGDFDRTLAIEPNHVAALYNRGVMLANVDRHREAVESFDRALAIDPTHVRALNNRGVSLGSLDLIEGAIASFERALAIKPDLVEALLNRGLTLADLNRHDEAILDYDRVLAIDAHHAEALFNRGSALVKAGQPAQALISLDQALAVEPGHIDAICNRGAALVELNRHADAVAAFRRATALEPEHREANWNEALALLRLGDFHHGWPKYEWRWASKELAAQRRTFTQPLWLGEPPLQGKTILLHAEQGFGDTIQFVRYVPLIARLGARVVVEVQGTLTELMSSAQGASCVIGRGTALPDFDFHCPLLSLPLALGTTLETIPAEVPYIVAPQAHLAKWQSHRAPAAPLRVGVAWAGSRTNKNDRNRSIALVRFAPLFAMPGIEFVSLQKEIGEPERHILADNPNVMQLGDRLDDFADTAAVISGLDLVVSADTAVAHLAGAMARPVFILVPFAPDFRWMLDREDTPWYPTAKLFRQPTIGDWDSVLDRVRGELSLRLEARRPSPAAL